MDMLAGWSPLLAGSVASLLAGLATALGGAAVFLRPRFSPRARSLMLALAAGVMLSATVFSLILPALELASAAHGGRPLWGAVIAVAGIALGALCIWLVHRAVPHEHFVKGPDGRATIELGRHWLFILAITLHNFPEGMSVGVAWGGDGSAGVPVTLGIGLQNIPEGLAVAAALIGDGFSRARAFSVALLTGLVEPVGGVCGALSVAYSEALLPWGLSFAGGAMLFVVSGEVIPETHAEGEEQTATFALVAGFCLMMVLDVTLG